MNTRKELEKVVEEWFFGQFPNLAKLHRIHFRNEIGKLVQSILAKLPELVEIDKEKLREALPVLFDSVELVEGAKVQFLGAYVLKWKDNLFPEGGPTIGFNEVDKEQLAHAIASATGLIKRKEGK
jgi:hypothetical protein